jgi:hypothetical protein
VRQAVEEVIALAEHLTIWRDSEIFEGDITKARKAKLGNT